MKSYFPSPSFSSLSFISIVLVFAAMCTIALGQDEGELFRFKKSINTEMWLSKTMSISPDSPQVVLGSKDGNVKVFNYKTGNLDFEESQGNVEIVGTVWANSRNGLIIASNDEKKNESTAIIRDKWSFEEIYRWQFNHPMKSVDYTETVWQSYVGFNLGNRVEEYGLRLKNRTAIYYAFGGLNYQSISYSSNYAYLYMTGIIPGTIYSELLHVPCGSIYNWYYWVEGAIQGLEADKFSEEDNPFFFNYVQDTSYWRLENYRGVYFAEFPTDYKFKHFEYCSNDYILGVTELNLIIFYTRNYRFTPLATITLLNQQHVDILQIKCKNGHILITGTNNYLYVFQMAPFEDDEPTNWLKIAFLAGIGFIVILIFFIIAYKKVKHSRMIKKTKLNEESLDHKINKKVQDSSLIDHSIQPPHHSTLISSSNTEPLIQKENRFNQLE